MPERGSARETASALRRVLTSPRPPKRTSSGVKGCKAPLRLERLERAPFATRRTRPDSSVKTSSIRLVSLQGRLCRTKARCQPSICASSWFTDLRRNRGCAEHAHHRPSQISLSPTAPGEPVLQTSPACLYGLRYRWF